MAWRHQQQIAQIFDMLAGGSNQGGGWHGKPYYHHGGGGRHQHAKSHVKGKDVVPPPPAPFDKSIVCTCCGKEGHAKKMCWHRTKNCLHCNKVGHMREACRDLHPPKEAAGTPQTQPDKNVKEDWLCHRCLKTNEDKKKIKCCTKDCKGVSPLQSDLAVAAGNAANQATATVMSKRTAQLVEENDQEKIQEECVVIEKQIEDLETDLKKYSSTVWGGTSHVHTDWMKTKKLELQKNLEKLRDNSALVKSMAGDQSRENHNHEARLRKMKEDLDEVRERKQNAIKEATAAKEEEELRHKRKMAKMEEQWEDAHTKIGEEEANLAQKLKAEQEEHAKKRAEWAKAFAKETAPDLTKTLAEGAVKCAEKNVQQEDEIEAFIEENQKDLEVVDQLTASQTKAFAKIMKTMFDGFAKKMTKDVVNELTNNQDDEEGEEDEGDEFQTASGKRRNRPQRTRPKAMQDHIIDDSTQRKAAEKRAGGDLSKEEQEKEQKAGIASLQGGVTA